MSPSGPCQGHPEMSNSPQGPSSDLSWPGLEPGRPSGLRGRSRMAFHVCAFQEFFFQSEKETWTIVPQLGTQVLQKGTGSPSLIRRLYLGHFGCSAVLAGPGTGPSPHLMGPSLPRAL